MSQSDMEQKMGVEEADVLLAKRWKYVVQVADLRARYGPFGTFDHLRKIELARLKALVRVQALRDKRRISNDQADDEAHASPDYVEFIAEATKQRAQWVKIEAAIEDIDFRLYRGQAIARFAASEARL